MVIIYSLFLFIFYMFYRLDYHNIVYQNAAITYRRLRVLGSLVSTQHKNIGTIIRVSMYIILKSFYISFLQYINKSMKKIDKNTYELSYVLNGKLYKLRLKMKRGPRDIIQIIDHEDNDVTEHITTYLGPMDNFHGDEFTPDFFGKDSLTFYTSSGDEHHFERHSSIKIDI